VVLVIFSFIFTYIYPSRFIIDLNLIRVIQYLLFFLIGYSVVFIVKNATEKPIPIAFIFALLLSFMRFRGITLTLAAFIILFMLIVERWIKIKPKGKRGIAAIVVSCLSAIICIWGIVWVFRTSHFSLSSIITLGSSAALLLIVAVLDYFLRNSKISPHLRKLLIVIPLIAVTISYIVYHVAFLKLYHTKEGFWKIQHNWIDMQQYVKKNTPINAMFLVPHDTEMGGFRIFSERKIICSYRDCGIIGFDYAAAVEWKKRLKDIEPFQVIMRNRKPLEPALVNALLKYRANYIVFMRYFEPKGKAPGLQRIYANPAFALYKVIGNPVPPLN